MDKVGLGWRAEIAPSILAHLEQLDLVEVIADECFGASRKNLRALRTLKSYVPVTFHGLGLGLSSSQAVCERHLGKLASVLEKAGADSWSEHLAFVRAGTIEIGHLAAPPRNPATLEGTLKNLQRVKAACGSLPRLENVSTLVDPPGSTFSETEFLRQVARESGAYLLLDLHNLYANCLNVGCDPFASLQELPLGRVKGVHLSGGHWIPEPDGKGSRLLDDHVHGVPDEVFALLEELAALTPEPLEVIIERDGRYPPFPVLLDESHRARAALKRGRERRRLERSAI